MVSFRDAGAEEEVFEVAEQTREPRTDGGRHGVDDGVGVEDTSDSAGFVDDARGFLLLFLGEAIPLGYGEDLVLHGVHARVDGEVFEVGGGGHGGGGADAVEGCEVAVGGEGALGEGARDGG